MKDGNKEIFPLTHSSAEPDTSKTVLAATSNNIELNPTKLSIKGDEYH